MTHSALASRYASALVDVATGPKSGMDPHVLLTELRGFEEVLAGSAELRSALASPAVPPARKRAVVGAIGAKLGVSRVARNFLFVLTDHRRIAMLTEVLEAYDLALDERLGFQRAEISSARELTQPQRDSVSDEFERLTGKKMRMRYAVNRELLGGLVARIGSTVYDGSVRGQLQALGRRLAAE
ncbi:MAG TPA: ATP synthase F1 subunit delta [Bryobacteraceae bacterium]|nr:ATP synthase F1 subunit delta [Bryobacteraceae bacterium]